MSVALDRLRPEAGGVPTPGLKARLKGGIVAGRRRAKNAEEEARTLLGALRRTAGLEARPWPAPLFEPRPFAMRPYRPGEGLVEATIVTPDDGAYMHTFFDVCPLSASERYLAVTRLPFEHRGPYPGDMAEICIVDLQESTIETVYRTAGWALQLGANIQWHPSDDGILFCNDLHEGRGVGVMIDRAGKRHRRFEAPFYAVDPKGRYMLGPALDLVNRTQYGYGVPETPFGRRSLGRGTSHEEGIWRTDLDSGRVELLTSIADLVDALPERDLIRRGINYLFHTKINGQGDRLFQVMRSIDLPDRPGAVRSRIVTLDLAGGNVRQALPHVAWDKGGHHPSWLASGREILMNLVPGETSGEVQGREREMRFVCLPEDGSAGPVPVGKRRGSGHPTIESGGRFLLTDAYLNEGFGAPDGLAPLRLIDLRKDEEHHLLQLDCGPPNLRARRVDPHPVWGRAERKVVMNGVVGGRRQVLIADLAPIMQDMPET